jgi:mRNA-degrading endonuclease YafQ of YafQ-DinJ toxin-antitoxin module
MYIQKHKHFDRMWKKLPLKIREKAIIVIRIFAEDPTHISLHNHALVGQYIGFRSIDVT